MVKEVALQEGWGEVVMFKQMVEVRVFSSKQEDWSDIWAQSEGGTNWQRLPVKPFGQLHEKEPGMGEQTPLFRQGEGEQKLTSN